MHTSIREPFRIESTGARKRRLVENREIAGKFTLEHRVSVILWYPQAGATTKVRVEAVEVREESK